MGGLGYAAKVVLLAGTNTALPVSEPLLALRFEAASVNRLATFLRLSCQRPIQQDCGLAMSAPVPAAKTAMEASTTMESTKTSATTEAAKASTKPTMAPAPAPASDDD